MPPAVQIFLSTVQWNSKGQQGDCDIRASGVGASQMSMKCSPTAPSREASQSPDLWASPQQPDRSKFKPRHQPMGWGEGQNGPQPGRSTAATSAGGVKHQSLS